MRRAPGPRATAVTGLVALAVAMGIGRFAFTPLLPMMQVDAGLSVADAGWLASANYLGYLIGAASAAAVPLGAAAGIRAGLLGIALTTLGMGLTGDFWAWLALRTLAGIGSAWVFVFASAWCLGRLAAAGRSGLGGVVYAGVGIGIAAAGGLCLLAMRAGAGSAEAWLWLGAIAGLGAAAVWRAAGAGEPAPGAPPAQDAEPPPSRRRWTADFVRVVLAYGTLGFGYIIPATFVPAMARRIVDDPLVFGLAWPVFGLAAAVSTLVAAAAMRRLGIRRLWALSHGLMALGAAAPVLSPGMAGIVAAALAVGGTFVVATMAGMQEARVSGGADARRLMGLMTAAFAVGQIAGPLLVVRMVGADGSVARPLAATALLLVATAVALGATRARPLTAGSSPPSRPGPAPSRR
jgi:MFS family permease